MVAVFLVSLLLAVLAFAAPRPSFSSNCSKCSTANAKPTLPANQTALVSSTETTSYIALGVGVQNYTCNATSLTYTNVGAVAELFDISCLYGTNEFSKVQDDAYTLWNKVPSDVTAQSVIQILGDKPFVLGQHYYVPNPVAATPAISPKWDFTSDADKGNAEAFVIGAKVGDLPAPTGPSDIDWLQVKNVQGELATTLYRVDTKAGQPPSSCTAGSTISVKYTAKYWLLGGSIKA